MSDVLKSEIRRLFDAQRDQVGLRARLARHVGVTAQSVGGWVSGANAPKMEHWAKIEDFFGLDEGHLRRLVIEAGETPPTPPAVAEPGMDGATMLVIVRRLDDVVQRLEALADRQESPGGTPAPRARRQPAATSRRKARTL